MQAKLCFGGCRTPFEVVPLILLLTAGIVVFLDQITKALVRGFLSPGQSIKVLGFLRITCGKNPGSAFGFLPYHQSIFMLLTFTIIIFILFYYRRLKPHQRLLKFALGLEVGAAIGNLIDRIFFTQVTDFLDLGTIGVFNVADIAIAAGILIIGWVVYASQAKKN